MAIRTISNTGGNYNSTGTWVEGIVPTSADDVVSTATSGQLTVNVSSAAQSFNLSTYTNTLTMNANWTIGGTSLTSTIGSGMTFAGTAGALIINAAHTLVQNGTQRIPILQFGTGTKTLNTDIYTAIFKLGSFNITINGNKIYCNGNFGDLGTAVFPGIYSVGTTEFVLDGTGLISHFGTNKITVNTSGSYDTIGRGLVLGRADNTTSNSELNWVSGSTGVFNCILYKQPSFTDNVTLNFNVPTANLWIDTKSVSSTSTNRNINITLNGALNVASINSLTTNRLYISDLTPVSAIFSGNSVSATTLNLNPAFRTTSTQTYPVASNGQTSQALNMQLPSGFTHYFGNMVLNGGTDKATISSVAGTATVNLGDRETSQIYNYNFTNIDASGGEQIVAINGTLSGTTNITTTYPSGGGGGSFTFVN